MPEATAHGDCAPCAARTDDAVLTRGPWLALAVLCTTALLERLSGIGVMAVLPLYLTEEVRYSSGAAVALCGWFGGGSYLLGIVGGRLADSRGSYAVAVVLGLAVLVAGGVSMALGMWALGGTLNAIGYGLYRPSLFAMLGRLRGIERATTMRLLYVAVNLSGAAAPFAAQAARARAGWHGLFALAALCVSLALAVLMAGRAAVTRSMRPDATAALAPTAAPNVPARALLVVYLAVCLFMALFAQNMGTLVLWARDGVDRTLGGFTVPTEWLGALPSLCLLLVMFVGHVVGTGVQRWHRAPSAPAVMALGLAIGAVTYAMLGLAAQAAGGAPVRLGWLVAGYGLLAVMEACIAPVALRLVSQLAPPRLSGLAMGLLTCAFAAGSIAAGQIGLLWPRIPPDRFFALLSLGGLVGAALVLWQSPRLRAQLAEPNT